MSVGPPALPGAPPPVPPSPAPPAGPVVGPLPTALLAPHPARPVAARVDALLAGGIVRLATAHGPVSVALDQPPPRNAVVGLLLRPTADGMLARLLPHVPGRGPAPTPGDATGAGRAATAAGREPAVALPSAPGTATAGRLTATATLLTPMAWSDAAAAPGGERATPSGTAAAHLQTLPAGTRLSVRWLPDSAAAPAGGSGASGQAALQSGGRYVGHVLGASGDGTMLKVAGGVIAVAGRPPAGTGSPMIEIAAQTPVRPGTPAPALPEFPAPAVEGADEAQQRWPALREAADVLAAAGTAGARSDLAGVVPRPDRDLAAALMRFLAALRGGGAADWPGPEAKRALESRSPELAGRVADEMREAARAFEQPTANDWRTAALPFAAPDGWRSLRLFLRGRGGGGTRSGEAGDGTRFVVDVRLSRLGRLQLDGLVPARGARFDLMVRTETPLPAPVRDSIRSVFADATAAGGLAGSLGFRTSPPGFVDVESVPPGTSAGGIVA